MSNRRLLDRMVTPEWMSTALRIARMGKSWAESRQLLEVALRDEIESPTGRKKSATVLAGSWLKPASTARPLVDWAKEHAAGDVRVWHLGVLLANYSFVDDVCGEIGRTLALSPSVDTAQLRHAMKSAWGDRDTVNVATRSTIRTLRSFGVLVGEKGEATSEPGDQIVVEPEIYPWLIHALLVARRVSETDLRNVQRAPELFMFKLPGRLPNSYPNIERFTEGGGREVVGIVERRQSQRPAMRQMTLGIDLSEAPGEP